jgi:Asp-tRNA(Asn)/Glu-tRNA(Gln) amidotransferase A subunit family amidase
MPIGQTSQGLPVGKRIIGDTFAHPLCFEMAHWLETAWRSFVPPLAFV